MVDLSQQHFVSFFMELKRRRSAAGHAPSHAVPLGGVEGDEQTYAALVHDHAGTFYARSGWKGLGDEPNDVHPIVELMNWNSRWHAEGGLLNALAHGGHRGGICAIMVDRRLCGNCNKRPELEPNGILASVRALQIAELFVVEYLPHGPPSFRKHVWTPSDPTLVTTRQTPGWATELIARAALAARS